MAVAVNARGASGELPGVIFAMRYDNATGFVWDSMARTYDAAAALLAPVARSYVAYPAVTPNATYTPRALQPIEGDLYRTERPRRSHLAEILAACRARVVVYMGCEPREISLRFLRRHGVRTISYEQESFPPDRRQSLFRAGLKQLLRARLKYNLHDLYLANAEHQRRFLLTFAGLPAARVHTVVNGVDTDLFRPGPPPDPAAYGLPRTAHYALTVCQARPEKRVDFLIDVAAEVFRRRPDLSLTFVCVGDGQCLPTWRERADRLGLTDRFTFAGFHKDVAPLHRLASFLVHAAERESFGFVLAEAMATGRPVIASDAPGPREIIADGATGFVVAKHDVGGFAGAVVRLAEDEPLRTRLGEAALLRARELFSKAEQARRLQQIIRSCLAGVSA
jgi:glycosyltransferase involved in cell wall biosynthesis